MKKQDFYFELPQDLIAQRPIENRSASKMMIIDKEKQTIKSTQFTEIKNLLKPGDVLVLNNTKVILARLLGVKEQTFAKVEILLLKEVAKDQWETLVGNARVVKVGSVINISDKIFAKCVKVKANGIRIFDLKYQGNFYEILNEIGWVPLPPYIHEKLEDKDRYQTVYAKNLGSAAAPTAGLHFTKELLKMLADQGVIVCYITLHVGLGTFMPVKVDDILKHKMHSEQYIIDQETATILNKAKALNNKIVAVGTTSVRTLESNFIKYNQFKAEKASTDIFIYPGISLKAIDGLITNFHLPESTLIMLVSAFAGYDLTMKAYRQAVSEQYRFFSFGDVMWIS